jgi:hypothetical protein
MIRVKTILARRVQLRQYSITFRLHARGVKISWNARQPLVFGELSSWFDGESCATNRKLRTRRTLRDLLGHAVIHDAATIPIAD